MVNRFSVVADSASEGFRVFDAVLDKAVDGPFRDEEDALARAAKRENRDALSEEPAEEAGAGASIPLEAQESAPAEED